MASQMSVTTRATTAVSEQLFRNDDGMRAVVDEAFADTQPPRVKRCNAGFLDLEEGPSGLAAAKGPSARKRLKRDAVIAMVAEANDADEFESTEAVQEFIDGLQDSEAVWALEEVKDSLPLARLKRFSKPFDYEDEDSRFFEEDEGVLFDEDLKALIAAKGLAGPSVCGEDSGEDSGYDSDEDDAALTRDHWDKFGQEEREADDVDEAFEGLVMSGAVEDVVDFKTPPRPVRPGIFDEAPGTCARQDELAPPPAPDKRARDAMTIEIDSTLLENFGFPVLDL